MKRGATVALSAFIFILSAEGIARVAEWVNPVRERPLGISGNTFLIVFVGDAACLKENVPEQLEHGLHRAGITRASVLNLCRAGAAAGEKMTAFLEYGLPLGPQVVVSFDGAPYLTPGIEHLALRRLVRGSSPGPQSMLNSYLYATEVIRTLTKSQSGWFGVLQPVTRPITDALAYWSAETGAPVFEDRERLFEAIVERYRDWEQPSSLETVRSSLWPR
jgi:hypothetical protein